MKKMILLLYWIPFVCTTALAQSQSADYGVDFSFMVLRPVPNGFPIFYPRAPVEATVMYKDADQTVLYTETHSDTLDESSFIRVTIGEGDNPQPAERLPASDYAKVKKLCWKITVQTQGGPVVVEEMQKVNSVPKANYAFHAQSAERLGDAAWNDLSITVDEFIDLPADHQPGLVAWNSPVSDQPVIQPLATQSFFLKEVSVSTVSGDPLDVLRIGSGYPRHIVFGPSTPAQIENYYTVCVPSLHKSRHGLGVKVQPQDTLHNPTLTHNTAAIYADNSESPMSAGVLANAQTWGLYGTGQNGTVGISTGAGNGAAIWGSNAQAPGSGGFKYALYGNSMSFTGSWGAAIFGNGFYTGTWSMSSDARLKTEIRAQTSALDKVMQLRPSQYRYRQDTPYSLPEGIHHGFLAQEMAEVFPELVSDITMPVDPDPQKMHTSETTQYKAINYIEMITILTSAVQELNGKITAQAQEIAKLKEQLK